MQVRDPMEGNHEQPAEGRLSKHQVKVHLDDRQIGELDDWRRRLVAEYGVFVSRPEALRIILDEVTSNGVAREGR